ncbi:MAG: TrmB family transcriptional regulator [Kofleriaceae bacterium]
MSYNSDTMGFDELRNTLERLGLSGHEPSVYASLLEQSPASAAWIAKRCGLSRSSVYATLGVLVGKGLVGTTHRNDVKQFVAGGAAPLLEALKTEQREATDRVKRASELVDEIARLAESSADIPQVMHFEGAEGLRRIYLAMLRATPANGVLRILRDEFVYQPAWAFIFEDAWRARVKRHKEDKNLSTRLLVNRSPEERRHARYYGSRRNTERRYLAKPVQHFGLYLAGDTAAVLSLDANHLLGVRIVNRHIAKNFEALFDALWDR